MKKKVLTFPGSNQSAVCHHAFNLHGGVCVWPSGGVWPTFQPWVTSRLYAPAALKQDLIISQNRWQSSTCWSVFAETCYSSQMNKGADLWHFDTQDTPSWRRQGCTDQLYSQSLTAALPAPVSSSAFHKESCILVGTKTPLKATVTSSGECQSTEKENWIKHPVTL